MPKQMKAKKERSEFEPLNANDESKLAKLPKDVPTLGLRWDEIDEYIESFHRFRRQIMSGDFRATRIGWWAAAKYRDSILVHDGCDFDGPSLLNEEENTEEKANVLHFKKTGVNRFKGDDWFIIDEKFIVKAWAIGVFRHGYEFEEDYDDYIDEALQFAHWGFINQG
jgi:hypothetical protein